MKVASREFDVSKCEKGEIFFHSPSQTFLSLGKEYEVYALSVYKGVTFLLVLDDLGTPTFYPRFLFEVVESCIPNDWICNAFGCGEVSMVIGPDFIADSVEKYNDMVDQRMTSVDSLMKRVRS